MVAVKDLALACHNTCHHFYEPLRLSKFEKKNLSASVRFYHEVDLRMFSCMRIPNIPTKLQSDLKIIDFFDI